MTRKLFATCILSLAFTGAANAQSAVASTQTDTHYTKAQLKELKRSAHTPEQYKVLASYFGEQQKSYLHEAMEEKKEWGRRSQNVSGAFAKYPRPVDSARNLYEYYMGKVSESSRLEAKYSRMADPDVPGNEQ